MKLVAVKPRAKLDGGILYARGVKKANLTWLTKDCQEKGMTKGEYVNEILDQLRGNTRKKVATKRSSRKPTRK